MKKIHLLLLTVMVLSFSCGVEDDTASPDTGMELTTADVKTLEVVTIGFENINLQTSYAGVLGELDVELGKTSDSTLSLLIPVVESGEYLLEFELGSIIFNITQTELAQTKEEVISGFKSQVEANFTATVENPTSKGAEILDNILSNATEEEKQAIAIFFEANKESFNSILNRSDNNRLAQSRGLVNDELNNRARRFNTNVLQLGIGAVAVYGAAGLGATGVGALLAGAGLGLIYDAIPDALNEGDGMINEGTRLIDFNLIASGQRLSKGELNNFSFNNEQALVLTGNYDIRGLDETDRALNDVFFFNIFFRSFDALNNIISQVNFVIGIANEVPFVDIDNITSGRIPQTGVSQNGQIDASVFPNYSFSVENSNIDVQASLLESGELEITLTADESLDLSQPVETQLVVEYNDDFNTLSNTFDVVLTEESVGLEGRWKYYSITDSDIGTTDIIDCNEQFVGFVFTESTFTYSDYNVNGDGCGELMDVGTYNYTLENSVIMTGLDITFPNWTITSLTADELIIELSPDTNVVSIVAVFLRQ